MSAAPRRARMRFALDTILPADPAVIEADVLRLLRDRAPEIIAVRPAAAPDRPAIPGHRAVPTLPRGAPDLVLLAPGGRTACLRIKTQASRCSGDETAFQDLCRQQNIPFAIVRSAGECAMALRRFGFAGKDAE